jgi:hypothetical protein
MAANLPKGRFLRGCHEGAAWLSSARGVSCSLKWGNERNPCAVLQVSRQTALARGRKVGTTSNQHGPYVQGDTRATMAGTMGSQAARRSQSYKAGPSSDRGLQLDLVKPESLVTANQPRRREYVLGSCTHRPSSQGSR